MILFKMRTFTLFLLVLFRFTESQVNYDQIESCNKTQYYDTKHLKCKSCPINSFQNKNDGKLIVNQKNNKIKYKT